MTSPNGTSITTTSNNKLIVLFDVNWTLDVSIPGFPRGFRNGEFVGSLGDELRLCDNAVYFGSGKRWYYWFGGSIAEGGNFVFLGNDVVPCTALPDVPADAFCVPPNASVTDSSGDVWTIGDGGSLLRNGAPSGGQGYKLLLYKGEVYTTRYWMENYVIGTPWYKWNGTAWEGAGTTPPDNVVPNLPPFPPIRNHPPAGFLSTLRFIPTHVGPRTLHFSGTAVLNPSAPPPAGPVLDSDYAWDFGDGTNGVGKDIEHTFHADRVFDVTLYTWNATSFQPLKP